MSDQDWRDAERRWREEPSNLELVQRAVSAARRAGVEVPHELLAAMSRWAPLAAHVARWTRPLGPEDGFTDAELAATLRISIPRALHEFYRLAGKRVVDEDF